MADPDVPQMPESLRPSYAERARTLLARSDHGVLATRDAHGYPYPSLAELLPLPDGDVLFLLSDLAEHTQNAKRDARASLLVAAGLGSSTPLASARLSLMGRLTRDEIGDKKAYLERHPSAHRYAQFSDFHFYRLQVERLYFIGGFGRMGWADVAAYRSAEPDPLRDAEAGIREHMNDDHAHNLLHYVRALAGLTWAERATMLTVDRYGFEVRAESEGQQQTVRLDFAEPVTTTSEVRQALVKMAQDARAILGEGAEG